MVKDSFFLLSSDIGYYIYCEGGERLVRCEMGGHGRIKTSSDETVEQKERIRANGRGCK